MAMQPGGWYGGKQFWGGVLGPVGKIINPNQLGNIVGGIGSGINRAASAISNIFTPPPPVISPLQDPKKNRGTLQGNTYKEMFSTPTQTPTPTTTQTPTPTQIPGQFGPPAPLLSKGLSKYRVSGDYKVPNIPKQYKTLISEYFPGEEDKASIVLGTENPSFNPNAYNFNSDRSSDYGLFQINSNTFNDLLRRFPQRMQQIGVTSVDDLHDPAKNFGVARLIRDTQGWNAWYGPKNRGFDITGSPTAVSDQTVASTSSATTPTPTPTPQDQTSYSPYALTHMSDAQIDPNIAKDELGIAQNEKQLAKQKTTQDTLAAQQAVLTKYGDIPTPSGLSRNQFASWLAKRGVHPEDTGVSTSQTPQLPIGKMSLAQILQNFGDKLPPTVIQRIQQVLARQGQSGVTTGSTTPAPLMAIAGPGTIPSPLMTISEQKKKMKRRTSIA